LTYTRCVTIRYSTFLILVLLVFLGAASVMGQTATTAMGADIQVPGEKAAPPAKTDDEHPWSIAEKFPGTPSPRDVVEPEQLDSPRSLMWSLARTLDAYREALISGGRTYSTYEYLDWVQYRLAQCFDLSDVAPEFQLATATDAAVLLRGILLRVPMPDWDTIPDAKMIADMPLDQRPMRFRFKNVPIELIQIETGDRSGEWVISQETREIASDAYKRMAHLDPIGGAVGKSLHRLHFFEPGWLIPSSLINNLPVWTGHEVFGQAIWQWTTALIAILIVGSALVLAFSIMRRSLKRPITLAGRITHFVYLVLTGCSAAALVDFLQYHVFLNGVVLEIFTFAGSTAMMFAFMLAILSLGVIAAEVVIASPRISPRSLDAALIRVAGRSISIILAAIVFFKILAQLGFSASTLLAGASVTGLAVALAAQDTLKNFFASLILLMERPFREGDWVRIGTDVGTVEAIGLRSTSMRISDGNLIYMPNEVVANGRLENISRRPHIRCKISIGVTYATTPMQMKRAVEIIRKILDEKTNHPFKLEPRVHFSDFGDSALVIECTYWELTTSYSKSLAISQDVNLQILEQFNAENIDFAFPTMTINGIDSDVFAKPANENAPAR
jgi:MscS family membrane protein